MKFKKVEVNNYKVESLVDELEHSNDKIHDAILSLYEVSKGMLSISRDLLDLLRTDKEDFKNE